MIISFGFCSSGKLFDTTLPYAFLLFGIRGEPLRIAVVVIIFLLGLLQYLRCLRMELSLKEREVRIRWNAFIFTQISSALLKADILTAQICLEDVRFVREDIEAIGELYFIDRVDEGLQWNSLLLLASGLDALLVVERLLQMKASIEEENSLGHTALTWAVVLGHEEVVKYLLSHGASIYHITREERSSLHLACLYGHESVVRLILSNLVRKFFLYEGHSLEDIERLSRWQIFADTVDMYLRVTIVLFLLSSL